MNTNIMNLNKGEELRFDIDDLMEKELKDFQDKIKDINPEEINNFRNWLTIYKTLNYDIFEELKMLNVYRFNKNSAVVELEYKGNKEYDLLTYDGETVSRINVKDNKMKDCIRRILIPKTVDEALAYATRPVTEKDIKAVTNALNKINNAPDKYRINNKTFKQIKKNNINKTKEVCEDKKEDSIIYDRNYVRILIGEGKIKEAENILRNMYKDIENEHIREVMVGQYIKQIVKLKEVI